MKKVRSEEWLGRAISRMPPITPDLGPHRCGGIDESFLRQMAGSRKPSLLDPRVKRVMECSRCKWQLYRLREERRRTASFLWVLTKRNVFATVVFIAVLVVVTLYARRVGNIAQAPLPNVQTVDLSTPAYTRGSVSQSTLAILPKTANRLTLILPALSDPGEYNVALTKTNHDGEPLLSQTGVAVMRGPQTLLTVTLDLAKVPPGVYYLATSHGGDAAYYYPLYVSR